MNSNLSSNLGHITMATAIVIASAVLAWHGTITGGEFIGISAAVGGFSLGGSVASSSAGAAVSGSASASALTPISTPIQNPTIQTAPTPTPMTTPPTTGADV